MNDSSLRRPALWTAALPLACAVHCLLMPLVALFVPLLAPAHSLEVVFMGASVLLAAVLTRGGVRAHGRRAAWVPVVLGTAVWAAGIAHVGGRIPEQATSVLGSVLLAGGMAWNARLRHEVSCRSCGCPAHSHDG
ncbi:MAG: MerC domain-containing protein [Longimicrobiaceae bacterium]